MADTTLMRFTPKGNSLDAVESTRKNLRIKAAEVALNTMFSGPRFNICAVRESCTLLGATLSPEAEAILTPLHCVDWEKIPSELKAEIPVLLKESFTRGTVVRSMVTDMILGDFADQMKTTEVDVEVVQTDSSAAEKPAKKSILKWW